MGGFYSLMAFWIGGAGSPGTPIIVTWGFIIVDDSEINDLIVDRSQIHDLILSEV